ncbi:MAG: 50S ribosomal protein L28 [SAR202 cluster bacterium]|nr:50S ribosomal protein L28 [SAR202 cluster bacterium]
MASCHICNKAGQSGNNVSHSKRHTKRRWSVNLHRANIEIDGQMQKVYVCTRCKRTTYKLAMKD